MLLVDASAMPANLRSETTVLRVALILPNSTVVVLVVSLGTIVYMEEIVIHVW